MSDVPQTKQVEVYFPVESKSAVETKGIFDIYTKIKNAVERLEREFGADYEVQTIQTGVTITASLTPSIAGSVTTTFKKKKS